MSLLGIIGGSGLCDYKGLEITDVRDIETPFGMPSAPVRMGLLDDKPVVFLPRHGEKHSIAPHRINYRANLWALHNIGVSHVLAVAAVGGLNSDFGPGTLAVPDQIIDYTFGREQSFFNDDFSADKHIDFTYPYDAELRDLMLDAARGMNTSMMDGATYGAVQGPRLETAAEIRRMARDGCDLVGMTGMPEAYLARELGMAYATLAVVANWGAGIADGELTMQQIHDTLAEGLDKVCSVIAAVTQSL
ncbi:S-methyl-5'-thioinosine phosphorylase [Methylophaga sp. OBS4]|uniref:S-methyl-5'-thioinosine phosphorylase n=1 Tax=Methylophaga sp. OBS4 TaxID=2991935 RepID=UPI002257EC23|nr:S-methyl-5'-thioinosine phosphorylase [Methylophaga sp. OBS4]MCX4188200.1 S-methyl-5'-thioinosine phosphorylase [Methylophaga sp. OBS4]